MANVVLSTAGWKDVRGAAITSGDKVGSISASIETEIPEYKYFPIFSKSKLFSEVGLSNRYTITRYLYVSVKGMGEVFPTGVNWIGYIAKSDDRFSRTRRIVVAFRGTMSPGEWWKDLSFDLVPFPFLPTPGSEKVHSGVLSLYTSSDPQGKFGFVKSLREQITTELGALITAWPSTSAVEISVAGHSLGGALTILTSCDIGYKFPGHGKVRAFTFGSPKVGNESFKKAIEKVADISRFENIGDVVPMLPPTIPFLFPYEHVGTLYKVDWARYTDKLKYMGPFDFGKKHDLELYMYGIASQPNMYFEDDAFGEMGISKSLTMEEMVNELAENDSDTANKLKGYLKDLFTDAAQTDDESLRKYLLDCVYVYRRGLQGKYEPSQDIVERDYVLVNKWEDSLKDNLNVPQKWWVNRNKDVRQDAASGRWLPRNKRPDDQPTATNPEFN